MENHPPDFLFPDEFPYDWTDSIPSSPVRSLPEVDSEEDDKIEQGFSPQSTLCSDRDWEGGQHRKLHFSQLQEKKQQKMAKEQVRRRRLLTPMEPGMRALFLSRAVPKRESTGTGVFLPRNTDTAMESRKKPACSTVLVPARVVRALNLNLEEIGARPACSGAFFLDKDAMMARTRQLQLQQRSNQSHTQQIRESNRRQIRSPPTWNY